MTINTQNLLDYNLLFFFFLGTFSVYYFESQENRARVHRLLKYIFVKSYKFYLYLGAPEEVLRIEALDKDEEPKAKIEVPYEERYIDKYNALPLVEFDKEKLASLKNNIIIEKTPLGNVIMLYDAERESFKYYSDNAIPYRMLETVGRKYACTYHCKSIYIDMKEILKEAMEKIEQEEVLEKEKEEQLLNETKEKDKQNGEGETKKNVFAKFKKYNDTSSKGPTSSQAPQPQQSQQSKASNKKMILKEKANHYTCEGKIFNYSIIKKVDRKVVDKTYSLTFADYKRMMQDAKKNEE